MAVMSRNSAVAVGVAFVLSPFFLLGFEHLRHLLLQQRRAKIVKELWLRGEDTDEQANELEISISDGAGWNTWIERIIEKLSFWKAQQRDVWSQKVIHSLIVAGRYRSFARLNLRFVNPFVEWKDKSSMELSNG